MKLKGKSKEQLEKKMKAMEVAGQTDRPKYGYIKNLLKNLDKK